MATRMQQRRGTAAQWTAANPVLAAGEIGFETDTNKFKMGNGSSAWSALQYFANAAELAAIIDGAPGLLDTLNELAAAIGDDPQFFSSVATNLALHAADTTQVHGISDTSLLATLSDVQVAISDASSALSVHNLDTTQVHGIADTSVLATLSDVQNAADDAAGALSTHAADTTQVHGIADTSLLATLSDVQDAATNAAGELSIHAADTTLVHGIADTSVLVTQTDLTNAISSATVDQSALAGVGIDWNSVDGQFDIDSTVATKTYADDAVSNHNSDTTNVHGIDDTSVLETQSGAQAKANLAQGAAEDYADGAIATAVAALTKSSVGLGNVDNTADADKPISTATQTALDTKASLSGATFTGSVEIDQNLTVDGNLTVNGTTFNASATSITIEDNLVQLAHQNAANTVDLGIVVGYNDGTAKHSGIVRDVSADKWKLFKGVTTEPSTTVDFTQGSLDDLEVAGLAATSISATSATIGDVSNTELQYLNGVTSAVQTQLDAKAPLASPTFTGTVTVAANGIAFTDGTQTREGVPSRTPISQRTSSYTLAALTERDSLIELGSSSAVTLTIPTDATLNFPVGTSIDILQTSTGQVTVAGAAGVTVNATPGLKLRTTWSSATLMKRAANTWVVYGDLTA